MISFSQTNCRKRLLADFNPDISGIRHTDHRQARLLTKMQYIYDHYSEQITLDEIAQAGAVSKSSALAGISIESERRRWRLP